MAKDDNTLIFLVEDDEAYAHAILHSLKKKNYKNIMVFDSGEECIQNLTLNPEIILLDYDLGEGKMNGLELLKMIKQTHFNTQVVFLTGMENLELATTTIKAGAYDYVVKSEAATERIRNVVKRVIFENQIQKENQLLKKGRKIILTLIALLSLSILALILIQFI